jgi:hypothetical protein
VLPDAIKLINGNAGRDIALSLRRNGKVRAVTLALSDYL